VVPRGTVVIATATPRRTAGLPGVGFSSSGPTSSVRHVLHRPPLQGVTGRGVLTTRGGIVGSNSTSNGHVDALDKPSTSGRRRASITVTTATPAELQHRSRMARDSMIVSFNLLSILICTILFNLNV